MVRLAGWTSVGVVMAFAMPCAFADAPKPEVLSESQTAVTSHEERTIPVEGYRADNAAMQALVEQCRANAAGCNGANLVTRLSVTQAGTKGIFLREDWLVSALTAAKALPDAPRAELMGKAAERLREEAAEMAAAPAPVADGAAARREADRILARREFQSVQEETWLTRKWALIALALSTFLSSAFGHLPSAPWAVPLVEGGFLLVVMVGLVLWAWRTTQQQRVALATSLLGSQAGWQRESEDWAKRAEAEAAAGAWREAVHCVYWAAIVLLEGKRLWRANRARTPREYLPLLPAGSPVRTTLGGLTRIFERIWYGLRPANRADYEQAQALLETLKAG